MYFAEGVQQNAGAFLFSELKEQDNQEGTGYNTKKLRYVNKHKHKHMKREKALVGDMRITRTGNDYKLVKSQETHAA